MTGLPFVFAAWVTTSEIDKEFVNEFNKVLENGTQHIAEAIQESRLSHPVDFDPNDYLSNKINYNLDNEKKRSFTAFLEVHVANYKPSSLA